LTSANGGEAPAYGRGLTRFEKRRSAKIDIADVGENTDGGDQRGADKPNDDDFQMSAAIRAVHRVIH
jgi:hypothetical protein